MSKQKIVFKELFIEPAVSLIQAHPTNSSVFAATGDDQFTLCRFDWDKSESTVVEKNGLDDPISCFRFSTDGTRISCALRSTICSMDPADLTKAVDKRVFSDPISSIASFSLANQSYNLIIGDEAGNVHLIDTREATATKDRLFDGRTKGVSITSLAVDDKLVYMTCENGIIEVFDLKKRGFVMDHEFSDKMLTHIFMDEKTPVVSTDEGEILWIDVTNGRTLFNVKTDDLMIERIEPISNEHALVKQMTLDNLVLLSTAEHKIIGEGKTGLACDVASSCDFEQIIVSLNREDRVDVEVWETSDTVQNWSTNVVSQSRKRPAQNQVDADFFADLDED
ncbi:hypothetical protein M3Y97_00965900 [Aphelenchoides bicaudatus]|nr:hypothetical protein M3Y97_00965900 [Aphelenchoides bicaudatus]